MGAPWVLRVERHALDARGRVGRGAEALERVSASRQRRTAQLGFDRLEQPRRIGPVHIQGARALAEFVAVELAGAGGADRRVEAGGQRVDRVALFRLAELRAGHFQRDDDRMVVRHCVRDYTRAVTWKTRGTPARMPGLSASAWSSRTRTAISWLLAKPSATTASSIPCSVSADIN